MFHGKIYLHHHCKIQQTLVRGKTQGCGKYTFRPGGNTWSVKTDKKQADFQLNVLEK